VLLTHDLDFGELLAASGGKLPAAVTAGADVRIAVTVKDRPGGKSQATAKKSLK
jgi:hypothetical protein